MQITGDYFRKCMRTCITGVAFPGGSSWQSSSKEVGSVVTEPERQRPSRTGGDCHVSYLEKQGSRDGAWGTNKIVPRCFLHVAVAAETGGGQQPAPTSPFLKACSRSFLRTIWATFSVSRGPEVLGREGGVVRISPKSLPQG